METYYFYIVIGMLVMIQIAKYIDRKERKRNEGY